VAAAAGVPSHRTAVATRLEDFCDRGVLDIARTSLNRCANALTGNGARDENHLAVVPRQHPAAGRGPVDGELD
jgi:hypothetical protein